MINRRTALSISIVLASVAFAACSDAPTSPFESEPTVVDTLDSGVNEPTMPSPVPQKDVVNVRLEALRDALLRVHPTLSTDDRSLALAAGLRQAIDALERNDETRARNVLEKIEHTLQQYANGNDETSADVDVIRLAVSAASARHGDDVDRSRRCDNAFAVPAGQSVCCRGVDVAGECALAC